MADEASGAQPVPVAVAKNLDAGDKLWMKVSSP